MHVRALVNSKTSGTEIVEVFIGDGRVLCEASTAEVVLAHSLGSEEATIGKLLAVKSTGEIVSCKLHCILII